VVRNCRLIALVQLLDVTPVGDDNSGQQQGGGGGEGVGEGGVR
jgi:hypothetical protein